LVLRANFSSTVMWFCLVPGEAVRGIVVKRAKIICGVAAVLSAFGSLPALAQRVQFPSPISSQSPAPGYVPSAANPSSVATYGQPPASSYPPPSLSPPTSATTAPLAAPAAPTTAYPQPTYSAPPVYSSPPAATAPALAPGVAIQQPPATWDPYATPGATPSALLPQDPYFQSAAPAVTAATFTKFIQHVNLDYHWFAGQNGAINHQELGINDVDLSVTFALPIFFNSQTPLLVTPGFAVHYWDGPVSVLPAAPGDPPPADLPPQTFDAYLDALWNPQVTTWLGGELDARIGVYSDFDRVAGDSLRFTGKGMAVLTFSPSVKIKAGVWYLNRNLIKLLPAGGICWSPNADVYFDILFPNPKIGRRLTTWGNTEWWLYASGDYGGGKWAITRNTGLGLPIDGKYDTFDYNDMRVAVGLEFNTIRQMHGMFEVGFAFERELRYQSLMPAVYNPTNTVFLRAGLTY
jgi:hypothetical protein